MARPRRIATPGVEGWRPLQTPVGGVIPGFTRLARAHAASSAGDALVAIGLAGSLFFSISPEAARSRVALYLLLTMAPFALVAPLIGPLLDRQIGGRRVVVVATLVGRMILCAFMARDINGLLLFPEAFGALVLGKGYGIAKAALVPALVDDPSELVQANSKLTLVSGITGFAAAIPGLVLFQLGARWVLLFGAIVFAGGAVLALRLPNARASEPAGPAERAELRSAGVLLAASAMAVLRGIVGFTAFLLAFSLRAEGAPAWWFGVVAAVSGLGILGGAAVAPPLRRFVREERLLLGCLVLVAVAGLAAIQIGGRASGAVLAGMVGVAASTGRLCFDSIVQRDAPDADQGRSFARFETRFQLAWVLGALVPVALSVRRDWGYTVITVLGVVAAVSYLTGRQPWRLHRDRPPPPT
jgi:MFS family permease